ncbi:MAG: DUF1579 domain-containing protein [Leptolyngbyaceae cyanobacterium T60_A2020_046]|nr:DUF1579 domain-containing protein [Leptolyngbyaceae cyanobacterium T60_A2020_046]
MTTTEMQPHAVVPARSQPEHHWLHQLIGNWRDEIEAMMGPDQPLETMTGTEQVRSLGELWVVAEGQGKLCGDEMTTTLMTLGYDPDTQRYVGTWIGSMMAHLWVYDGELDVDQQRLTLSAQGPAMSGEGKTVHYRDVIELQSRDRRTLISYALGDDGQWRSFMTATYTRR